MRKARRLSSVAGDFRTRLHQTTGVNRLHGEKVWGKDSSVLIEGW